MTQPPVPPMPVQTLDYSYAQGPQRPGVVLAVAIMSLIVSLLSGFYAIQLGLSALVFAAMPAITATTTPTAPVLPRMGSAQTIAMVISSALSLLLAGYLLFASIMVFRNAPTGRKHHLRWVWVKVPVVLVGAGIYGWWMGTFVTGMMRTFPGQTPGVPVAMFYWLYAVFDGFLGLVYPVVVAILMNLRAVREYYLGLGGQ